MAQVAQLAGGAGEQRLRRARVALAHRARSAARSLLRTPAPIRRPPSGSSSIASSGRRVTSTSSAGVLDAEPHEVDEVRAAAEVARAAAPRRGARARRPRPRRARRRTASSAPTVRDRRDDVHVGAAAAQVAAHALADLVVVERRRPRRAASSSSADGRADLPGRAVAALEGVVLDERLLQRVQRVAVGQALDRRDRRRRRGRPRAAGRRWRGGRRAAPCRRRTARGRSPSSRRSGPSCSRRTSSRVVRVSSTSSCSAPLMRRTVDWWTVCSLAITGRPTLDLHGSTRGLSARSRAAGRGALPRARRR